MDVKESKKQCEQQLLALIKDGSVLRDTIEREYRQKRRDGTFNQKEDPAAWSKQYAEWHSNAVARLDEIFDPPILVLNRFKHPTLDASSPAGENKKWVSLMKHMNARLAVLDSLYQIVNEIKEVELSDYIELNIDLLGVGKIKVDKILSRLSKLLRA